MLFAPVSFDAGVYARRGFYYSPATVIGLGVFASHLFLRPRYNHYYFGDYYAANYEGAGFYRSYSYYSGRYGYDPIYAHERWQDPQWERGVAADFQNRRDHEDARPPRTLAAMQQLSSRGQGPKDKSLIVASPLAQLAKRTDSPLRFQPMDKEERQKLAKHGQEVQTIREERQRLETAAAGALAKQPSSDFVPARARLPKSPIVAKPVADLGKDHAPPKTYAAPKPDLKVEPKPRNESRGKATGGESRGKSSGESKGKSKT